MSRDDRSDYHHDIWTEKKLREVGETRDNRMPRWRGNSGPAGHENDTSPRRSALPQVKSERDASFKMLAQAIITRDEISKCRDVSPQLKTDLSDRLISIDLTLPDAETRLQALAEAVEETAEEKYDLYLRGGKPSTGAALRDQLWSIRMSLKKLAGMALEYQIDFRHPE